MSLKRNFQEKGPGTFAHVRPKPSIAPELLANSWEKGPSEANYEMELDLVSGKEALSVDEKEHKIGHWTKMLQNWEDERKTGQLKELASSETCCRQDEEEHESIYHGELIKRNQKVLQQHHGEAPVQRSGKRGRSPPPRRRGRRGKASSKRAKARDAKLEEKRNPPKVDLRELHYSKLPWKETFTSCGRKVSQLVQDLLDRKVSLSANFLQLTVFETRDPRTNQPLLRCTNNHRLFALKEYAKKRGKDHLMVNVNFFSQNTVMQVQRFMQNCDETDGREVRLRKNKCNMKHQTT